MVRKYRVWNKTLKYWDLAPNDRDIVVGGDGTIYERFTDSFGGESYDDYRATDEYEVFYSTELYDKNTTEIYEGDIVKTTLGDHVWHYIIRRHEDGGSNLFRDTIYRNFDGGGDYEDTVWGDFWVNERSVSLTFFDRFSEVIGNIIENPDLYRA